jgi:putative NADPH-quinone reductase
MVKKILVLLGNSDVETFSGEVASAYVRGASAAGHMVERVNIGDLVFDPILHKGYKVIQELEPDLVELQKKIQLADHFVLVYPNWWCAMPAILKGLFDRMWLPGFAFNFDKETRAVIQRLSGKTARVIILSGSHSPFVQWVKYGDYANEVVRGLLGFAGMKVGVTSFGPCERQDPHAHSVWIKKTEVLGAKGE